MADERGDFLRRRHSEPHDDASFIIRAEASEIVREELERIGIYAGDVTSKQRTQRNNAFLDRMANRDEEINRALDFVNMLIGRRNAAGERQKTWLGWVVTLMAGSVGAAVSYFLSAGAHK